MRESGLLKGPAAIAQHHPNAQGPRVKAPKNIGTGWALNQRKEPFNRTTLKLLDPPFSFLLFCHRAFFTVQKAGN